MAVSGEQAVELYYEVVSELLTKHRFLFNVKYVCTATEIV